MEERLFSFIVHSDIDARHHLRGYRLGDADRMRSTERARSILKRIEEAARFDTEHGSGIAFQLTSKTR